jgi:hypothetical protein
MLARSVVTKGGSPVNTKRYLLASLAVFVFFYFVEYLIHAVYLAGPYEAVPNLFRPEEEKSGFFVWLTVAYVILALAFAYIFTRGYQGRGIGEGARYGVLIWLVAALPASLFDYAVQPWPAKVVGTWIVAYLIEIVLAGVLLALIYRPRATAG